MKNNYRHAAWLVFTKKSTLCLIKIMRKIRHNRNTLHNFFLSHTNKIVRECIIEWYTVYIFWSSVMYWLTCRRHWWHACTDLSISLSFFLSASLSVFHSFSRSFFLSYLQTDGLDKGIASIQIPFVNVDIVLIWNMEYFIEYQ